MFVGRSVNSGRFKTFGFDEIQTAIADDRPAVARCVRKAIRARPYYLTHKRVL